jgi:hypothetical protein
MGRAYSPTEILAMKYKLLEWAEEWRKAFDNPESSGVWFIWGNSGNGKSSFVMQLVKELAKYGLVFYNALEEGTRKTMQDNIRRSDIISVKKNVKIGKESIAEMILRASKRKSPQFYVVDSFQYTRMNWKQYLELKETLSNKLIIFISHAEGNKPKGKTAGDVKYDADLKIWVEGFKAISNGRYNPGGEYVIWDEAATKYWGTNNTNSND